LEKKRIHPTEVAFTVTEMLEAHFPEIVDSNFTAKMEETLDEVAEGNTDWQTILKAFYTPFLQKIEDGKKNIKSLKIAIPTGENCPKCNSELLLRKGRYGEFIACSNFPKCKYTKNTDGTEVEGPEETDEKCEKCSYKSEKVEEVSSSVV
jgi:DNA topoisomerase-1